MFLSFFSVFLSIGILYFAKTTQNSVIELLLVSYMPIVPVGGIVVSIATVIMAVTQQ